MSSAYQKAFTRDALKAIWRRLYREAKPATRRTVGSDGISLNDFELNSASHLGSLHRELLRQRFTFGALRPVLIKKKSGKDRLICVPTVRDRVVQRALLRFLTNQYAGVLKNKISYGFLPNRTVKEAAATAVRIRKVKRWVVKTDITAFFDKIPRERLRNEIRSLVRERSLYEILDDSVACEIAGTGGSYQKRIRKLGIRSGLGVRQGMPLSPFFSNVVLRRFDDSIIKKGYNAIRYADDLIFFSESRHECEEIFGYCQDRLTELELEVPTLESGTKSVIYEPREPAEFLGLEISPKGSGYELRLSDEQLSKILNEMWAFSSVQELVSRRLTMKNYLPAMHSKIAGYLDAYHCCSNYHELEAALNEAAEGALCRLYVNDLKIELKAISSAARRFLGI